MVDKFMKFTFSVILPTYNRSDLLGRAIRSVLAQTFQDFELLIVDDASPDNTQEIVQAFEDERIVYIRREQNGGPSATRNTGIKQAQGKYISFLDDDDEYLPELLSEVYQKFEAMPESIGFIGCGIQVVEYQSGKETFLRNQIPTKPTTSNQEELYLSCLERLPFGTGWGMTIRPACFDTIGLFDTELKTDVDRDLILRLVRHFNYDVIEKALVKIYRHKGPKVTTYGLAKAKSYEKLIEKNFLALSSNRQLWAEWHYKTGWLYYHSGKIKLGRQFMLTGLRRCPYHLKSWFGLALFEIFGTKGPNIHQYLSNIRARTAEKS